MRDGDRTGAFGRPAFTKATARSLQPSLCTLLQTKAGAGDEARTRDVHLGKVVLYQLSYTRSFEMDNNVQPSGPRNLLIALEWSRLLNPNRPFSASYDQTAYEKTIPPLYLRDAGDGQLTWPGSNGYSDCQPDSSDRSDSRDSGNLNSGVGINTNGSTQRDVWFRFIGSR